MANDQTQSPVAEMIDSKSSVFERTDPDLRRGIDQALIDRQPPTYKAVYDTFNLRAHGVSFTAFYYYARRVRVAAALAELARTTLPEGASIHDLLPQVLSHRLLEAAIDEDASPRTLQRLADAYRVASQTHFAHRRLAAQLDDLKKKELAQENDQLLAVANQYIKARTNDLQAQAVAACPSPHAAPDGPTPPS